MTDWKRYLAIAAVAFSCGTSFANTAHSTIGYGSNEAEATAAAKAQAEKDYRGRIAAWGAETCSKKSDGTPDTPGDAYNTPKHGTPPVYACSVDFTVKD